MGLDPVLLPLLAEQGTALTPTLSVIIAGLARGSRGSPEHAFVQNLRRGHYELGRDSPPKLRVATAFNELARAI